MMDDPDRKDAAGNCLESDETTTKLTWVTAGLMW